MKILGYEIRKNDKENRSVTYPTLTDALTFGGNANNYSAMNISAVYRAVEIISDNIAMLPIQIKIKDKQHIDVIDSHPIYLAFDNNILTKYTLIKLLIQSVLLKGNGYCYIERNIDGSVNSLRYLDSGDVTVHYDKNKQSLYYTCNVLPNKKIEACNMLHLVKNSYDGIKGISTLSYAIRSVNVANHTENQAAKFFTNGCNLSGVLTVQGQLSNQQRQDIRNSWNTAYSDGGSGLAVLQGNMDYKPIQLSAKESQMLESRQFNVSDIARFFGISPVLLGDLTHSSYSTIEATQAQFLMHTLQPYITMIEEEFTRKLFRPSESNLEINLDTTALLKTDKTATASYYSTLLDRGILCINEVRKELGYSQIDGGDKHLIAYTKVEDNTINTNKDGNKKN